MLLKEYFYLILEVAQVICLFLHYKLLNKRFE